MIVTKCIIVGDSGVGKSSLSSYYVHRNKTDHMHIPTIGIEFYTKKVEINEKSLNLYIWDTAGQERFKSITRSYYRDSYGALLCFSITNIETFHNLQYYIKDLKSYGNENIQIVLVGTFSDLENKREVTKESAQKLADELGIKYFEVSSYTGQNVDECFDELLLKISDGYDNGYYDYNIYSDSDTVDLSDNYNLMCCNIL